LSHGKNLDTGLSKLETHKSLTITGSKLKEV